MPAGMGSRVVVNSSTVRRRECPRIVATVCLRVLPAVWDIFCTVGYMCACVFLYQTCEQWCEFIVNITLVVSFL